MPRRPDPGCQRASRKRNAWQHRVVHRGLTQGLTQGQPQDNLQQAMRANVR
jgi:hypothetical protein